MKLYRAGLTDLKIGQTLYTRIGDSQWGSLISEDDYKVNPTGYSHIDEISATIIKFTATEKFKYSIKYLDKADLEILGFSMNAKNIFIRGSLNIVQNENNILSISNIESTPNSEQLSVTPLFLGTILNLYELKEVLRQIDNNYIK